MVDSTLISPVEQDYYTTLEKLLIELEGGHPQIGADLLKRHGESTEVVHAAFGHHDEIVSNTLIRFLQRLAMPAQPPDRVLEGITRPLYQTYGRARIHCRAQRRTTSLCHTGRA